MKEITTTDAKTIFPEVPRNVHKGSFGKAAIVAGSLTYSGAAMLSSAAISAMRLGAGYSTLYAVEKVAALCRGKYPETLVSVFPGEDHAVFCEETLEKICESATAVAVGMGMTAVEDTFRIVEYLVKNFSGTLVVDADGLNALAAFGKEVLQKRKGEVLLTPHPAEFSRLTGTPVEEILRFPEERLTAFCKDYGVSAILKSAYTLISDGEEVWRSSSGCAGMAKAGSGDVLSGALCGVMARRKKEEKQSTAFLAACGCYVVGRAGEIAEKAVGSSYATTPSDTAAHLPEAIREIVNGK